MSAAETGVVLMRMDGRRPDMLDYPLLPGDVLRKDEDGTWWKVAPGLAIGGFVLSDEDVARLAEQTNERWVMTGLEGYFEWCMTFAGETPE
jgi:hypothetical protein